MEGLEKVMAKPHEVARDSPNRYISIIVMRMI